MIGAGAGLPRSGTVFVSVANRDKRSIILPAQRLAQLGFRLTATRGTAAVLSRAGIPVSSVRKRSEGHPNVVDFIEAGKVDLIVNTPFGREPRGDGYFIRTAAAAAGIPCITTIPGVVAAVQGIEALGTGGHLPRSLQELHAFAPETGPAQLELEVSGDAAAGSVGG
jgi:carbamoyl-phosphate synthase large subunit